MIYFCSDLDNTLIYSYRHDIGNSKVLVETKDGKELSYMTKIAHSLLKKAAQDESFVPLTTRSIEQYSRINFGEAVPVKYALAVNGGILLEHGKIDTQWQRESKDITEYAQEEMEKGIRILEKDPQVCFQVRKVDELFVFTKSNNVPATLERLKEALDIETVYIDCNGAKVYITPTRMNKGASLKRFHKYVGLEHRILSAGDSEFDIPMLLAADKAYCPQELLEKIKSMGYEHTEHIRGFATKEFCQEMLQCVLAEKTITDR